MSQPHSTASPPPWLQDPPATRSDGSSHDVLALIGVIGFTVLAGMTSGLPVWALLISFALVGTFLWFGNAFAFYLAVIWLAAATLIPWLAPWESRSAGLSLPQMLHALAITGLLAAGLAYLEHLSPAYRQWQKRPPDQAPRSTRDTTPIDEEPELSRSLAGLWWTLPIAMLIGQAFSFAFPYEDQLADGMSPTDELLRLFKLLLVIAVPTWMASGLVTLLHWRRLTPLQSRLYLLRVFHQEQRREQRAIEKRLEKLEQRE